MDKQKRQWAKHLGMVVAIYNQTPNSTTGFSPHFLIFGRDPKLHIHVLFSQADEAEDSCDNWVVLYREALENAWKIVTGNLGEKCQGRKLLYNKKVRGNLLEVGQLYCCEIFMLRAGIKYKTTGCNLCMSYPMY